MFQRLMVCRRFSIRLEISHYTNCSNLVKPQADFLLPYMLIFTTTGGRERGIQALILLIDRSPDIETFAECVLTCTSVPASTIPARPSSTLSGRGCVENGRQIHLAHGANLMQFLLGSTCVGREFQCFDEYPDVRSENRKRGRPIRDLKGYGICVIKRKSRVCNCFS